MLPSYNKTCGKKTFLAKKAVIILSKPYRILVLVLF